MSILDLGAAPISTQIVQRDRHAEFMSALALLAGTIEKIALQVRHYQRTEVLEAEEYFAPGQKGSSAMPHKRNPIISERLCGQARVIRGNLLVALENVALWHERDISHSSAERVIFPDSTILLHYMLKKACWLVDKLNVYPENMAANIEKSYGLVYSQRVLLALVEAGILRDDAYRIVQRSAMKAWEEKTQFARPAQGRPGGHQQALGGADRGALRPQPRTAQHGGHLRAGGRPGVAGAVGRQGPTLTGRVR